MLTRPAPSVRPRRGFTLLEVVVTAALMLVLVGVVFAYPRSGHDAARDHRAQSAVSSVLGTQVLLYTRDGAWLTDPAALVEVSGQFTYRPQSATSSGPTDVSLGARGGQVAAAARSETGRCWLAKTTVAGARRGTVYASVPTDGNGACSAATALSLSEELAGARNWTHAEELP